MKMAKASAADLDAMQEFFESVEEIMESGSDDDKLLSLIHENWFRLCSAWRRVVFGCEILINNACDKDLSYLEWKPSLRELIEAAHRVADSGCLAQKNGGGDE